LNYLHEDKFKAPGQTGTFGNMAFSHDIIHQIGGQNDSNKNTTQRILLLLESVELSALRQPELIPLVQELNSLDLSEFEYISFHAPSFMDPEFELHAIKALDQVAQRQWPIILHPDALHEPNAWAHFGTLLCIENMDKRKSSGQTASQLNEIFSSLPNASLCFDIGHARQVDPTMSEATAILQCFHSRLRQLHISEVNSQSKHDTLSFESVLAFRKVAHLIPEGLPAIIESRVAEEQVEEEIRNAQTALLSEKLAIAGD
jgi:hypothetical protein